MHNLRTLLKSSVLAILATFLLGGTALAAYAYKAPISITENASTSHDMVAVLWDQNNDWLAANGYMNATANDTRVQTLGGLNKPWLVADNKTLTAIPVPADSRTNLYFATGESEASAMDIIVGYGGYITVSDDPVLELGDNFLITFSDVWIDTDSGADKNLLIKDDAIDVLVSDSVSRNITSSILNLSDELLVVGAGDATALTPSAGNNYECVDEAYATPNDSDYVYSSIVENIDYYTLESPDFGGVIIDSVTVYYRLMTSISGAYGRPYLRLNGVNTVGAIQSCPAPAAVTYSETLSRPGGGDWTVADIHSLQVGIGLWTTDTAPRCTQISVVVDCHVDVALTGVTSGEHDLTVSMDYPFYGIDIDGSALLPIPDNAGDLVLNLPMWQADCDSDPFYSIDSYQHECDPENGVVWSSDGYVFDGTDDQISITHAVAFNVTNLTIRTWVKFDSVASWFKIVAKGSSSAFEMWIGTLHEIGIGIKASGVWTYTDDDGTGTSLSTDTWYCLTIVYDGTNMITYLNGVQDKLKSHAAGGNMDTNTNDIVLAPAGGAIRLDGTMGEIIFYDYALTPAQVEQDYNATKWKYETDTDRMVISTLAEVPDNANDYVLMDNSTTDFIPYMGSYEHVVGGTTIARYEPNDIISGTILPDREGTAQNGTITWGANPAGAGATLGSMISIGQPDIGATTDTSTTDVLPIAGGTDWRPDATVSVQLQANPLRPVVVATSDNTTLTEYQVWVWFGIIFVVFVTVLVGARARGHHLITGIAASSAIVLLVVWTVFPLWALVVVLVAIVFGLVSERSPHL